MRSYCDLAMAQVEHFLENYGGSKVYFKHRQSLHGESAIDSTEGAEANGAGGSNEITVDSERTTSNDTMPHPAVSIVTFSGA